VPTATPQSGLLGMTTENSRVVLLVALTFVTGSVDAVSYLGLDRVFTANMTGNVALLGFAASGAHGLPLLRSGGALLAFALGAVVAGRAVRRADSSAVWPVPVAASIGTAAVLLMVAFVTWVGRSTPPNADLLAALIAFAMGLQGGATRKLAVADLPTTVVTSTLTGLAADSQLAGGHSVRWRRRTAALAALMAGAFTGASLVNVSAVLGLLPAMIVLSGVTVIVTMARLHAPGEREALAVT
jgi:uncharacterized membrane protein YoaK (UPF0700 family)